MTGAPAPAWFTAALAQQPQHLTHTVDGLRLAYRAWGGRGLPVVLLVHGGSAHGGWWDHVGPLLAAQHRVLAPDLSGHGDSDHRDAYGLDGWAGEVAALAEREAEGSDAAPTLIGHSMGGWVSLMCGAQRPELPAEIVVIDSPLRERPPEAHAAAAARWRPETTVYPTRAEALEHFRLTPAQDRAALPFVMAHVAATSVRAVEGGWTWKFDPRIFRRFGDARPDVRTITCPVTLLSAERGMQSPQDAGRVAALMPGPVTIAQIPDAGHHVMMDEPLALVTALRLVLARAEAGA